MELDMRISDALRRTHEVHELTAAARRSLGVPDVDASLQFLSVCMIDAVYGSPESAALLADQAFEIAANIGNAEMALRALNWKVIAFYQQARLNSSQGQALISTAVDVASGAHSVGQRFRLEANLGVWHMDVGDYPAAQRSFDRASQLLRSVSAPHLRRNLTSEPGTARAGERRVLCGP